MNQRDNREGLGRRKAPLLPVLLAALMAMVGLVPMAAQNTASAETDVESADDSTLPPGPDWVVGMGDSFMSGEGGRFADNGPDNHKNSGWMLWDAYKPANVPNSDLVPYYDTCHKSGSAPMFVLPTVNSVNLACSGAETKSFFDKSTDDGEKWQRFKSGIDFLNVTGGSTWCPDDDQPWWCRTVPGNSSKVYQGQALQLERFASTHRVRNVTLSIGGNDFGFQSLIERCVTDYLLSVSWAQDWCNNDKDTDRQMSDAAWERLVERVRGALSNIRLAMKNAGYSPGDYLITFQGIPQVVGEWKRGADGDGTDCGLPIWNADVKWARQRVVPFINDAQTEALRQFRSDHAQEPRILYLDTTDLFKTHELCSPYRSLSEGGGIEGEGMTPDFERTGKDTYWVRRILIKGKVIDDDDAGSEPMHPMYWGQKALGRCGLAAMQSDWQTWDWSKLESRNLFMKCEAKTQSGQITGAPFTVVSPGPIDVGRATATYDQQNAAADVTFPRPFAVTRPDFEAYRVAKYHWEMWFKAGDTPLTTDGWAEADGPTQRLSLPLRFANIKYSIYAQAWTLYDLMGNGWGYLGTVKRPIAEPSGERLQAALAAVENANKNKGAKKIKGQATLLQVTPLPTGERSYRAKIQKRDVSASGKVRWSTVKKVQTRGSKGFALVDVPHGKYRAVVMAQHGLKADVSSVVKVKK